ncbi:hypothetical protein [Trinickia mobilis]|uniref:hypothetical protein n=1 Tax=Trinickia mobilis TaxID=2816356 RepID=UPI001A8D33C1|nr:hypothetical protein [Trinickia mobilis]
MESTLRGLITIEHGHPSTWTPVPDEVFEDNEVDKNRYLKRKDVVIRYANGESFAKIFERTGTCKSEVIRFVRKCVRPTLGEIPGFFALIPYKRSKSYERHEPSTGGGKADRDGNPRERGFSGCCRAFFEDHPEIRQHVHDRLRGKAEGPIPEARPEFKVLWHEVLAMAKAAGVSDVEWPFRLPSLGRSGFYKYFREFIEENARETDVARHGEAVASRRRHDPTLPSLLPKLRHLSCLQLDYAKIDAASIFEIELPNGQKKWVAVRRWYWGMLYCPRLKAVVGFHVSLSRNPAADDAIDILESEAMGMNDAGLLTEIEESEGAIILNGFFPEFKGHGMSVIRLDNGWANLAGDTLRSMLRIYGCAVNLGRVAQWMDRIEIEREFGSVTRRGPARLSSTYGVDPTDSRRTDPNEQAEVNHIRLHDVIRILAKAVRAANTLNKAGLYGSNPVAELDKLIRKKASGVFPMPLPRVDYEPWIRFAKVERAVVRAGSKKSRRLPYVEKWGATYTNKTIFNTDKWIGKTLILFINRRNANQAFAVSADTKEYLGMLHVTGRYADVIQTISERRQCEADIRDGYIANIEIERQLESSMAIPASQPKPAREKAERSPKKPADVALDAAKKEQSRRLNGASPQQVSVRPKPVPVASANVGSAATARVLSFDAKKKSLDASAKKPPVKPPMTSKTNRFGLL